MYLGKNLPCLPFSIILKLPFKKVATVTWLWNEEIGNCQGNNLI